LRKPLQPQLGFRAQQALQDLDGGPEGEASDHDCEEVSEPEDLGPSSNLEEEEIAQGTRQTRKARKKAREREKRRADRRMAQQAQGLTMKAVAFKKRARSVTSGVSVPFGYRSFRPSKPGWKGQPEPSKQRKTLSLAEVLAFPNMKLFPWDGL
jgi:hypothetical protein